MSTAPKTISYIATQLEGLPIRTRPMFGEYGLYFEDKIVGLVCDDTLFIKKTAYSDMAIGAVYDAPPYPGAKPYVRIPSEKLIDAPWLCEFVIHTAQELPRPKPKKK